jgi:SsrA-binding protein
MKKRKTSLNDNTIARNKKASHDYYFEETVEAGLVLKGWEVKSLRAGKCQLIDSYVVFKNGEALLVGGLITPLSTAVAYVTADPRRDRKLLLHKKEIERLQQKTQAKGYTCVCIALYWKAHMAKASIALAKGKQDHDKRAVQRDRDWQRDKQRIMKQTVSS